MLSLLLYIVYSASTKAYFYFYTVMSVHGSEESENKDLGFTAN